MPNKRRHPLTKAEFARRAGRSRSTITEACQGPLAPACMPRGRIDAAHPAVQRWAADRGINPTALVDDLAAKRPRSKPEPAPKGRSAPPDRIDLDALLDLTLREITDRFSSQQGFTDWLQARKITADTRRLELANAETAGRLISRELVKTHVFGAIDGTFRRLLGDVPKTIARRLLAAAASRAPVEDVEREVRDIISRQLRDLKVTAARKLRDPKARADKPQQDNPHP